MLLGRSAPFKTASSTVTALAMSTRYPFDIATSEARPGMSPQVRSSIFVDLVIEKDDRCDASNACGSSCEEQE